MSKHVWKYFDSSYDSWNIVTSAEVSVRCLRTSFRLDTYYYALHRVTNNFSNNLFHTHSEKLVIMIFKGNRARPAHAPGQPIRGRASESGNGSASRILFFEREPVPRLSCGSVVTAHVLSVGLLFYFGLLVFYFQGKSTWKIVYQIKILFHLLHTFHLIKDYQNN